MGTSGARKGYKIFSINTTIRNPKRNTDFLIAFKKFDGQLMDDNNLYLYLFELVKKGIYQFTNVSETIKNKIESDIELTPQEVITAIKDNPQATGLSGRVMTQLRSLKDQGFLIFKKSGKKYYITISKLGNDLIENKIDASIIYTKALIGMHSNNPCRTALLNESIPFLNTIFVINEVNKKWKELGNEPKGILKHEFATFVLSMKDCNYLECANEIIKYRLKYKYTINEEYILKYLNENDILPLAFDSIVKDYPDEVFRKFEMTGLLVQHGKFNYVYYDFSKYNYEKVKTIINTYKDYSFKTFNNQDEYYNYLSNIDIPWENNETIKNRIVRTKAEVLNITLNDTKTLEEKEIYLDRIFYNQALAKAVAKYDYDLILNELLILSGSVKGESKFHDIPEPLRLEYLLALSIGKKYGLKGLISNIIYNEEGLPLHCAPSSKCDIIYHHIDGSYILEPTMQRGRNQQLNNETTNIVRHMQNEKTTHGVDYRVMMVAPYIHPDVVEFFRFKAINDKVNISTLSIEKTIGLISDSENIKDLNKNYDSIIFDLKTLDVQQFVDKINSFRLIT